MKENFKDIINSNQPVLVDFYADWCSPCHTQAPILKELANEIRGKARVIKIDVDKNQPIAQQYQVRSIPTLILFKNGQTVWKQSGVATKQQLLGIINQYI
jgi:thioredoxin 1